MTIPIGAALLMLQLFSRLIQDIQKIDGILKVEKRAKELSLEQIYTKYFREES